MDNSLSKRLLVALLVIVGAVMLGILLWRMMDGPITSEVQETIEERNERLGLGRDVNEQESVLEDAASNAERSSLTLEENVVARPGVRQLEPYEAARSRPEPENRPYFEGLGDVLDGVESRAETNAGDLTPEETPAPDNTTTPKTQPAAKDTNKRTGTPLPEASDDILGEIEAKESGD